MFRTRLFPGSLQPAQIVLLRTTTTLAGGVGNGYFASGAGGAGSIPEAGREFRKLCGQSAVKRPSPLVPRP
jgi:hypothetical protein